MLPDFQLPLIKPIDVLVASYGGVGTSFLMHHLTRYRRLNCPHNIDHLKHLPYPPNAALFPNLKAVYLFGDPADAFISLFRRGYHAAHSRSMRRFLPDLHRVADDASLLDTAKASHDPFGFATSLHSASLLRTAAPHPAPFAARPTSPADTLHRRTARAPRQPRHTTLKERETPSQDLIDTNPSPYNSNR